MAEQGGGPRQGGNKGPPCPMVVFGTSGDLTRGLLIPAIYNLSKAGRLSDNFALIGVDRSKRSVHAFRDDLADGIRKFVSDTGGGEAGSGEPFDQKAWDFLGNRMHIVDGDVTQPNTYTALGAQLEKAAEAHQTQGNVLFYMA